MPKARTILIIGIVLVVAAAAYVLLFPQENQFDKGYSELKQIWAKQGIDIETVDFDNTPLIITLKPYEVSELRTSFENFQSDMDEKCLKGKCPNESLTALQSIVQINIRLVSIIEKTNEFTDSTNTFEVETANFQTLCIDTYSKYNAILADGNSLIEYIRINNSLINNFNKNYAAKYNAKVLNLLVDNSEFEQGLTELKSSGAEIERACGD